MAYDSQFVLCGKTLAVSGCKTPPAWLHSRSSAISSLSVEKYRILRSTKVQFFDCYWVSEDKLKLQTHAKVIVSGFKSILQLLPNWRIVLK